LVATARNEGLYLIEWIAYHRLIGVEHIFLYSNDNDDGSDDLLSALADAGVITWIQNRLAPGGSAQYKAYGHALGLLPNILDYRWSAILDLDEFFVYDPAKFSSIRHFLAWHEQRDADAICVNWMGASCNSASRWTDVPVTRRFPVSRDSINPHVKSVFRPSLFIHSSPHFPRTDERLHPKFLNSRGTPHTFGSTAKRAGLQPYEWAALSDEPDSSFASINHYFFKSSEEFLWKASRNRGDLPTEPGISQDQKLLPFFRMFLETFSKAPSEVDDRVVRCAPKLEEEMASLRSVPDVARAEDGVRTAFRGRMKEILRFYRSLPNASDVHDVTARVVALAGGNEPVDTKTPTLAGLNRESEPVDRKCHVDGGCRDAHSEPIIHIEPRGGIGNRMIQLMAAIAIKAKVPHAKMSNVTLPEWGLEVPSLMGEDANVGVTKRTVRMGRRYQLLEVDAIANCLATGLWSSVIVDGYSQHVGNFLSPEAYSSYFRAPAALGDTVRGFDEDHLVFSVRGREILNGHHIDYVQIPVDFYENIVNRTKLKPVFYGQVGDNEYCAELKRRIPQSTFLQGRGGIFDFEVLRRSKNIVPSISTFAWLAAFLSSADSQIFFPVLGLFNPMQAKAHNFLPLNDPRYKFFLFPICCAEDIKDSAAFWGAQRGLEGRWQQVQPEYLRQIHALAPLLKPRLGPYLKWFDEAYYLSKYPEVRRRVEDGTFLSGLQHFCDHGFEGPAAAFAFSDRFYSRTYPDAAWEVSTGGYLDLRHHFVEVGYLRGYELGGALSAG
jgi:hypothetical protein